jgi:Flp pilus assembly protein TadG
VAIGDRGQRGQTLVEFAFTLPLLLVFLLVLVDFGLAVDRRQMLQHAVREGARVGAVGATVAEIQATAAQPAGVSPSEIAVCYRDADGNGQVGNAGDDVVVSAGLSYQFTAGGVEMLSVLNVSPPSIEMTPSVQMRLERDVPGAAVCS